MVDFWVYDVGFLILFSMFVIWFLYSRRKNLSREGIIFMYRTEFGIKVINYIQSVKNGGKIGVGVKVNP